MILLVQDGRRGEKAVRREAIQDNRYVWLHCIDLESRFELTVKSFPLLKVKLVYGHFSFMWDLSERRLVMLPDSDDVMSELTGVKSPCCIDVKSSDGAPCSRCICVP